MPIGSRTHPAGFLWNVTLPSLNRRSTWIPGESEALALAQAYLPDTLLIDEEKGRQEAERRNIPTTGTLGVLADAAAEGLLDLPDAISRLRATNFHVSERLLLRLLDLDALRTRKRTRLP